MPRHLQALEAFVCSKTGISSDLLSGIYCATSEVHDPQIGVIFARSLFLQEGNVKILVNWVKTLE